MGRSTVTTAGLRCWCLALLVALPVLLDVAETAQGKDRSTRVVGYVSAGSPVRGASLSAYGPSGHRLKVRGESAETSNANGFFHLVVAGRPSVVRLFANGGGHRGHQIEGSL